MFCFVLSSVTKKSAFYSCFDCVQIPFPVAARPLYLISLFIFPCEIFFFSSEGWGCGGVSADIYHQHGGENCSQNKSQKGRAAGGNPPQFHMFKSFLICAKRPLRAEESRVCLFVLFLGFFFLYTEVLFARDIEMHLLFQQYRVWNRWKRRRRRRRKRGGEWREGGG